jgi:hypothetical protein
VTANAPSVATPIGTVTFTDNGGFLGTGPLSAGKATFSTNMLTGGSHSIGANYGGNTNFIASSGTVTQNVNTAASTTAVVSSSPLVSGKPTSTYGQNVIFTATVAVPGGLAAPTGNVNFFDGATLLGSGTITASSPPYTAVFQTLTPGLNAGTHTITAKYAGDTNYATSTSANLSQVVHKAGTTTFVTSNNNPSTFGQSVTFTATVQSGTGATAVGTVNFMDGAAPIGSTQTLNSFGQAGLMTSALTGGSHSITASYTPSANFTSTASNTLTQTVGKAVPTVTLTSSRNPAFFRQSITLTATVSSGAGTPTGTVTFKDAGVALPGCGGVALSSGVAQCTLLPSAGIGNLGQHALSAVYNGSVNFAAKGGSLNQQRAPAPRPLPQP